MRRNDKTFGSTTRTLERCGRLLRRSASVCLAFSIVACASQDTTKPGGYEESRTERLFATSYDDIANIYIDDVSIAELAVAGIDGLGTIDPAVSVGREAGKLSLFVENVRTESFALPEEEDTEAWGHVTAMAISAGRNWSPELGDSEPELIYEAVFEGILSRLDGFSRYAGREAARENRASREGFGGIGVRIRLIEEGVLILSVMEGTPAEASGLLANDVIVRIDGDPVAGMSQREAVSRLRGPLRSTVELTLERPEESAPLAVDVTRDHIVPQTVTYKPIEEKVAYLQVTGFNQDTTHSLKDKIGEAKAELGEELVGYILDLRSNPGGLLDQSVSVADLFLGAGRIVTTRGRHPDSHQYFNAEHDDVGEDLPMVVLINGGSASASEIVASALQDAARAVVVGSVSFGKGTVQTLLRLPNQGELTLTWARFHAPSGYALNKRGILPDICTSLDDREVDQLISGVNDGSVLVDRNMRALHIPPDEEDAMERLRSICPASDELTDVDIEIATRILMEPELYARALGVPPHTAKLGNYLAAE
jgi:carboxyl-terminal processing protease